MAVCLLSWLGWVNFKGVDMTQDFAGSYTHIQHRLSLHLQVKPGFTTLVLQLPGAPPDLWIGWKGRGETKKIRFVEYFVTWV